MKDKREETDETELLRRGCHNAVTLQMFDQDWQRSALTIEVPVLESCCSLLNVSFEERSK